MPRFYLRLACLPVLLLTAALLLIHAQPYNDHDLRQLLLPEGCLAPCFMGIRPGVTTIDEAVSILEASEWVDEIDKRVLGSIYGLIALTWSDLKPDWIKRNQQTEIFVKNKRVDMITIDTNFSIGEIRLTLGLPDMEVMDAGQDQTKQFVYYYAFYPQRGLSMQNWLRCGMTEPLYNTVNIMMSEPKNYVPGPVHSLNDVFRACKK